MIPIRLIRDRIFVLVFATVAILLSGCSSPRSGPASGTSLISITVSPSNPTISLGASQQFTATGNYSDGVTRNLTASALWNSTNPAVGTIESSGVNSGLATGVSSGSTIIQAASDGIQNSTTLIVTSSAVPAFVQHDSSSNTRDNGMSSPYCYRFSLPNPTTAGNAVVVGFTFESNPAPTITDDKNDSYAIEENYYDGTDNRSVAIGASFKVAAGARNISVCFGSDPGGYVEPMATEFANATGIDGSGSGNRGLGTIVTAGSVTPAVTGDLIYQITASFDSDLHQAGFTAGSQENVGWYLLSADLMDGLAAQYGIYSSTGAINPTMSMGNSAPWASAAILLKPGRSGGMPLGMRIVHLDHENIPTTFAGGGNGSGFANPLILQFPSSGNLLVAMAGGGNPSCTMSGMTDSDNNAWAQAGSTYVYNNNDTVQMYYAQNSASSTSLSTSISWTTDTCDWTILFYDITGAAAAPLDTTNGTSGFAGTNPPFTLPYTITPAQANEIILVEAIWDSNTGTGLLGASQLFDANLFSGEPLSGPQPVDQNNGWGHYYAPDTSSVGFTWVGLASSQPFDGFASVAVAFKSAGSGLSQLISRSVRTTQLLARHP